MKGDPWAQRRDNDLGSRSQIPVTRSVFARAPTAGLSDFQPILGKTHVGHGLGLYGRFSCLEVIYSRDLRLYKPSITHKYCEPGHSVIQEVDNLHSQIKKAL